MWREPAAGLVDVGDVDLLDDDEDEDEEEGDVEAAAALPHWTHLPPWNFH